MSGWRKREGSSFPNKGEIMIKEQEVQPRAPIRRFDVFAEYNRQKAVEDGMAPDVAKGYGLWLAKVVAARRFGHSLLKPPPSRVRETAPREPEGAGHLEEGKWRTLSGEPQTDAVFGKE